MRKPGGYAVIVSPDAQRVNFDHLRCEEIGAGLYETDTFTCAHCPRVVHVPSKRTREDEYFCRNCMARICPPCADHPCIPFMKKIEAEEEKDRILRMYGGI